MKSGIPKSLFIAAWILLAVAPAFSQRATQWLILKDGSYQVATKYEVLGDRVRYFSAERSEWEELPFSLVDWDATKKWQEKHSAAPQSSAAADSGKAAVAPGTQSSSAAQLELQKQAEAREIEEEARAERQRQQARTPEVVPGVNLPEAGGVFMLDVYRDKPEAVELVADSGEINPKKARNVARPTPDAVAPAKESIEMAGGHARVQAHIPDVEIYINLAGAAPAPGVEPPRYRASAGEVESRFHIVRVAITPKGKRVVGNIKANGREKGSEKENIVAADAAPFRGGSWIRFKPRQPLVPGQYALVEMVDGSRINADAVYDFGINAAAPENHGVLQPESGSKATDKDDADGPPILRRTPKTSK